MNIKGKDLRNLHFRKLLILKEWFLGNGSRPIKGEAYKRKAGASSEGILAF
jgi:hypothetical protein